MQDIEDRTTRREKVVTQQGADKILKNYWEVYTINSFLHQVYQKYKLREYNHKRRVRIGQRVSFFCWLVGRCKSLAYLARVRVAGRKLK